MRLKENNGRFQGKLHPLNPLEVITVFALLFYTAGFSVAIAQSGQVMNQGNTGDAEAKVIEVFKNNCALVGCHTGSSPLMGLKLTEDEFLGRTVNQPSMERPDLMRVKPGVPDSSYLVMKVIGHADIIGSRMPFGRDPLSAEDIATIVAWVSSLSEKNIAEIEPVKPDLQLPFKGWRVVNLPTTRMVDKGNFLFLISHRFVPAIKTGYDTFWGLDGSGVIFLNLGYAISNRFFVNLGRSNAEDNVELDLKYKLKNQYPGDKFPVSAAVQGAVNWITETSPGQSAFESQQFKFTGQAILSSEIYEGVAILAVPAILFNPDHTIKGEDPLVTIGLGARAHIWKSISVIAEWVPIVSGYTLTSTFGELNRFDSWGGGMELNVGGHVFQIIISNSLGLTTDGYMRGGGLDPSKDGVRLGFNIYRPLTF